MKNLKKEKIYKKKNIPKAIREQVWLKYIGKNFEDKCTIYWCNNTINVFNFHTGHNIPESKGGSTSLENLKPICANCNLSMSNKYNIYEWELIGNTKECSYIHYILYFCKTILYKLFS